MAFQVVEDTLRDIFLPAIFQGEKTQTPRRAITGLPVKQAGIALPNPTGTMGANWTASCVITGHLAMALHGTKDFRSVNHALLMGEGREEIRQRHTEEAETSLGEAWAAVSNPDAQRLGMIQRTGAWLLVLPSTVNGTELGAQEWRDSPLLCYGIESPDFPSHCDGYGAVFYILHALDCKKGGLITKRYNDLGDGVANLAGKVFTPAHVCNDPKIFTGCNVQGEMPKAKQQGK